MNKIIEYGKLIDSVRETVKNNGEIKLGSLASKYEIKNNMMINLIDEDNQLSRGYHDHENHPVEYIDISEHIIKYCG